MTIDSTVTVDARGGSAPWMVAGVATTVLAVVLGTFGSIGVLIDPLAAEFTAPRTQLVLLFAAALSVHSLAAPAAGRAMDRWGPRPLLATAAAGMAFGLLAPATASTVWVAVGGYGLGLGLASASTWVATTATVSAAFARRRPAALGLLTAGPAAGGVVLAPVMAVLAEERGPRFACAVLAALGVLVCAAGALLLGPGRGAPPTVTGDTAVRLPERGLRGFYAASLLMSLVVFVPLVHIVGHAGDLGLSPAHGAALLAAVSAASAAARLGAGWLVTPRTLPSLYRACHLSVAAAFVVWALAAAAPPMLFAAAVLFGAGYGAWLSLGPVVLASTCAPHRLGRALGTLASVVGIGGVVGPVLAAPLIATAPAASLGGCAVVALAAAAAQRRWDSPV